MSNKLDLPNKDVIEEARQLISTCPYGNSGAAVQYQRLLLEMCVRLTEADTKLSFYEKRPIPLTKP